MTSKHQDGVVSREEFMFGMMDCPRKKTGDKKWRLAVHGHKNGKVDLGVSKNSGTPKSSILIGFSIINHPFWGFSPYLLERSIFHNLNRFAKMEWLLREVFDFFFGSLY